MSFSFRQSCQFMSYFCFGLKIIYFHRFHFSVISFVDKNVAVCLSVCLSLSSTCCWWYRSYCCCKDKGVLPTVTLPKCQCAAEWYHILWILLLVMCLSLLFLCGCFTYYDTICAILSCFCYFYAFATFFCIFVFYLWCTGCSIMIAPPTPSTAETSKTLAKLLL